MKKEAILEEMQKISKEALVDRAWMGKYTFSCRLEMSEALKGLLSGITGGESVKFMIEHWADVGTFRYMVLFDYDVVVVNELAECEHVNTLLLEIMPESRRD